MYSLTLLIMELKTPTLYDVDRNRRRTFKTHSLLTPESQIKANRGLLT